MRRRLYPVPLALLLLSLTAAIAADDRKEVEKQLKDLYEGKVVAVRGFYEGKRLQYSSEGTLVSGGARGSWTLFSKIEVNKVSVDTDKVRIEGRRLYLTYHQATGEFRALPTRDKVAIEVAFSSERPVLEDVQRTLAKVFYTSADEMEQDLPDAWQDFLSGRKSGSSREGGSNVDKTKEGGAGTTPPRCIHCPAPSYTRAALRERLQGIVVLVGIVTEEGRADQLRVIVPLGLGLDEEALKAVRKWRFEPSRRGGVPARAEMTLEVYFALPGQ